MLPGRTYHLYTHTNGAENLFRSDENFWYFLKLYKVFTTRGKGLTGLARIQQLVLNSKSVNE